MASPIFPMPGTGPEQSGSRSPNDDRSEFVESPERRSRSGRGALTGILLGAGLWAAILAATGVIKL